MTLVQTINGLIDRSELEVKDIIQDTDNARSIATEWYHKGELVRRDVAVSVLRGESFTGEQAAI